MTALAIYTLHRIAGDLLHSAIKKGIEFKQPDFFTKTLAPIKSFDWNVETSPLSALGGMKGVGRAYDLLSEVIGQEKDAKNAEQSLRRYT